MPPAVIAAGIGAAGAIGGGMIASSGAKKAAQTQAQAATDAQAAQERMFQQQVGLQEPFRQAGLTAQQRIMELLGLGRPTPARQPRAVGAPSVAGAPANAFAQGGMLSNLQGFSPESLSENGGVIDIAGLGPVDVGALFGQYTMPTGVEMEPETVSPDFGKYARDFGMADFEQDPGYAFRQSEGMKALERSAAARGGLLSGKTLKGIQRFGQDLASQEYQNAFNRYQVNRANQLNPLQSLMGAGQTSANVLTGAAGQAGQNQASNLYNAGAARASGYVGSANALGGAISGIGQMAAQYPMYQAQTNYFNSLAGGRTAMPNMTETARNIGAGFNTPYTPLPFEG